MVKNLVSIAVVLCLLIGGAIFENYYLNKQFDEFNGVLTTLYDKIKEEDANENDVYSVQNLWLEKKRTLHVFIPHTEIKEIDLWLSEAVKLVHDKEWTDAISKIEVLLELSEQIPKTFSVKLENIF